MNLAGSYDMRKELTNWCKHLLSKAGITTVKSQKVVPDAPPQFDFASDDVSKEGRGGRKTRRLNIGKYKGRKKGRAVKGQE
jgi:hypothetical protein